MSIDKIAFITDSGSDVPQEIVDKYHIRVLPLGIIYGDDEEYLDKITITEEEVYQRLEKEIPKTSLPKPEYIVKVFDELVEEGYQNIVVSTISSGLSGTFNSIKLVAQDYPELDILFADTLNIGCGSGLVLVRLLELLEQGATFEELKAATPHIIDNTTVFFTIPTLKYLEAGGRIGKVQSLVGNLMNLNPVISCNEDGIYHTVAKARGRRRSIARLKKEIKELAKDHKVNLGVAFGQQSIKSEAKALRNDLASKLNVNNVYFTTVSPALGIHTGPDIIGAVVQILEK